MSIFYNVFGDKPLIESFGLLTASSPPVNKQSNCSDKIAPLKEKITDLT